MPRGSRQRVEPHVSLIGNRPTEYSRDGPAVVATPALRHDDEKRSNGSAAPRSLMDRSKSRARNTRFLRLVERATPRLAA
jgi:hypothetical protein